MSSKTYYVSTSVTYDGGQYNLGGDAAEQKWSGFYSSAEGYYMCDNQGTSCSKAYYISGGASSYAYVVELTDGNLLEQADPGITIGTGINESGGTYTLTGTSTIYKRNWFKEYSSNKNKYFCGDGSSTSCSASDLHYMISTSNYQETSLNTTMKFGSSYTYDGGSYTITDAQTYLELNSDLKNHHYTCGDGNTTCSTLNYVYYYSSGGTTAYAMPLTGGQSQQDLLEELLHAEDVNQKDSTIKAFIDEWYADNIEGQPFEDYIEDAIYCNDRSIYQLNGWDPNGGELTSTLDFAGIGRTSRANARLICANETDKFSVSNSKAQLTYPVGLITLDEIMLAGNDSSNYLGTGQSWWLGSPRSFNGSFARGYYVISSGYLGNGNVVTISYAYGVRPAVSLRPGTEYSDGDGSADKPYIVYNGGE